MQEATIPTTLANRPVLKKIANGIKEANGMENNIEAGPVSKVGFF